MKISSSTAHLRGHNAGEAQQRQEPILQQQQQNAGEAQQVANSPVVLERNYHVYKI